MSAVAESVCLMIDPLSQLHNFAPDRDKPQWKAETASLPDQEQLSSRQAPAPLSPEQPGFLAGTTYPIPALGSGQSWNDALKGVPSTGQAKP